ncbi:hemerythrin domain-containing protein [Nocardioides caldifontis]|uniref:hemerythrin domain-containing protein n=1 Tax=Nocardioides caldifontis TaxID=2588938 RepID=UPI0011DF527E|nr:hemerythrin domain-containing protein [Nocardioides caldifontis]
MSTTSHGQTGALVDTSVMPTLHTFHRREFRLAGGVVRGVTAGDLRRAAVVADHVEFLTRHLHHHHTIEDELMWPKLLERVPDELAPIVHLMESQHERVDGLIQRIGGLLPTFRSSAGAEVRDQVADLLDELHVHLIEHLDAEEQRLLPIAARTMKQAEWDAMGDAGRASTPRKELALTFGMYQYEGDPAVIAEMLAPAPLPVRVLVPRLARRAFRKYAERIHGTPTP